MNNPKNWGKLVAVKENILPSAVLAPSAHNTQPWRFRVGNNTLGVFVDWERHLEVSDPTQRELYISLGCAILNARVAAAHREFGTQITYFPNGKGEDQPVAQLTFSSGNADSHLASLFPSIAKRRTNRAVYSAEPLSREEREALTAAQHPNVVLVEDRSQITAVAAVSGEATAKVLAQPAFKRELSRWVRNSFTRKPDGMPGYAMGMPAAMSLVAPVMVKVAPIHKQEAPKIQKQIESASAVAIITTASDTPENWLEAGQLLEQLWLEATAAGLVAAPVAAAIEAGEDFRSRLQTAARAAHLPQALLRIGKGVTTDLKPTPRRAVEDCLK